MPNKTTKVLEPSLKEIVSNPFLKESEWLPACIAAGTTNLSTTKPRSAAQSALRFFLLPLAPIAATALFWSLYDMGCVSFGHLFAGASGLLLDELSNWVGLAVPVTASFALTCSAGFWSLWAKSAFRSSIWITLPTAALTVFLVSHCWIAFAITNLLVKSAAFLITACGWIVGAKIGALVGDWMRRSAKPAEMLRAVAISGLIPLGFIAFIISGSRGPTGETSAGSLDTAMVGFVITGLCCMIPAVSVARCCKTTNVLNGARVAVLSFLPILASFAFAAVCFSLSATMAALTGPETSMSWFSGVVDAVNGVTYKVTPDIIRNSWLNVAIAASSLAAFFGCSAAGGALGAHLNKRAQRREKSSRIPAGRHAFVESDGERVRVRCSG